MRQLGADEGKDEKDDRGPRDQVIVERIALTPKASGQSWQAERPGEKRDKHRHEIKREEREISPDGARPVSLHRDHRAIDHVLADADVEEFAIRPRERGNAPHRHDRERQHAPGDKEEAPRELRIRDEELRGRHREQRRPADWALCEKGKRERQVENPPPARARPRHFFVETLNVPVCRTDPAVAHTRPSAPVSRTAPATYPPLLPCHAQPSASRS